MDCDIWKPHKNQQHGHKEGGGGGGEGFGMMGLWEISILSCSFKKPSSLQYLEIFW